MNCGFSARQSNLFMSWVRHAVLSFFQRFKLENRELIQKELEKEPGAYPNTLSKNGS